MASETPKKSKRQELVAEKLKDVPEELLEEANSSLQRELRDFLDIELNLGALKRKVRELENQRKKILSENGWICNIVGVLNKEKNAIAVEAFTANEEISSEQMDVEADQGSSNVEQKVLEDQIPRKKKDPNTPRKAIDKAKQTRKNLQRKIEEASLAESRRKSQFADPGHPALQ